MRNPTKLLAALAALSAGLTLPGVAGAVPIVSLDLDPDAAGIQSLRTVALGSSFDVEVVIADVGPLNLYDFDLDFDAARLTALDVVDGGFLLSPTFESIRDLSAPDVEFAVSTLGLAEASGSGVLARVSFSADAVGEAVLSLSDLHLSAPFGEPIDFESLCCGRVVIDAAAGVVPEPGAALLFLLGFALVARRSRGAAEARA